MTLVYCLLSFLCGSIPFGYLVPRLLKGVDIRHSGSGNPGATNVFRTLGPGYGIAVFILDFLKGYGPAALGSTFSETLVPGADYGLLFGIIAVLGHVFTPFLSFKGGKGVATAAGLFCRLAFVPFAVSFVLFWLVLAVVRVVAVASIAASLALTALVYMQAGPGLFSALTAVVAVLIVVRHKKNLAGLLRRSADAEKK